MTLALIVYLIGVIPSFTKFIVLIGMGLLLFYVSMVINTAINLDFASDQEEKIKYRLTIKKTIPKLWLPVFLFGMASLIPSERTMYTMALAYGAQSLAQTDTAKQLGSDGVDVLQELMQRAKRELAKDKEEVKK